MPRKKLDVSVKEKELAEVSDIVFQDDAIGGGIMEEPCTNGLHVDQLIPEARHRKRV
jgi:hypothetical protein